MSRFDEPVTFIVQGWGEFPFDQLRREHAWPTDTQSATLIAGSDELRRVSVTAQMMRFVNPKRWESFGWTVVAGFDEYGFAHPLTPEERASVGIVEREPVS